MIHQLHCSRGRVVEHQAQRLAPRFLPKACRRPVRGREPVAAGDVEGARVRESKAGVLGLRRAISFESVRDQPLEWLQGWLEAATKDDA
jgi:hypothetical protein